MSGVPAEELGSSSTGGRSSSRGVGEIVDRRPLDGLRVQFFTLGSSFVLSPSFSLPPANYFTILRYPLCKIHLPPPQTYTRAIFSILDLKQNLLVDAQTKWSDLQNAHPPWLLSPDPTTKQTNPKSWTHLQNLRAFFFP